MRRNVFLGGALLVVGWLVAPACGGGDPRNDGGTDSGQPGSDAGVDSGTDSGTTTDGGLPDAGPTTCMGFTPPTVPLQVASSCPGFTPCGGNPAGRWSYDAGCAVNPFTNLTGLCSGVTVSNPTGTISGCVAFSGAISGTVQRQVSWTITATATFPSSCVPTTCAALETAVRGYYPNATCTAVTGGCSCTITRPGSVNDSASFYVSGTDIIAGGIYYPFCVVPAAATLRYREAGSPPSVPEADLRR